MNPITELPAADFLVLYGALIGLVLGVGWFYRVRADDSSSVGESLPSSADPYEVACLRGGSEQVARVAVVSLVERGYLAFRSGDSTESDPTLSFSGTLGQSRTVADRGALGRIDRVVFDWFEHDAIVASIHWDWLAAALEAETLPYEERMQAEKLVIPEAARARIVRLAWQAAVVIASVGMARLAVGMYRHRPVGFLVAFGIAGLFGALWVGKPNRLTTRGRQYLESLQRHASSAPERGAAGTSTMIAATMGVAALVGTPFTFFEQPKPAKAEGGCGGGGDGGGCGGGCGGCGG